MTIKHVAFDGKSNFFLDQYPESAWVQLSPTTSDMADSRSATQAATNYYQSVAFLFRCVQIRQAALLNVPWAVVRNDKDIWTSEDSKPPADFAFMANFRRLLRNTEAALCLAPEAFWFRERNRARTLSLKWHAPSSVMPQYSESEGLTGFKRILGGGKERTFEKDDYIYFALPNPMHETIPGRPPAQAAMAAAGVLYNVDAFASAFFSRGAIKATLLTVEGNPQNSEMLKLESWWKRFFSGVKSAWETAAVRAGVKPVIIGEGMESLNQSTLTRERKEDIATALGIPHSIVMSDAANRSVAETDDLHFYDKTIIPEMEFLAETLNDQLFAPLGYEFVLRPQSMTVFQENEEQRSMSLLHYTQAGFPAHIAAEILGIDLPSGMDYAELAELISGQQAQRDAVAMSAMQARQAQTPRTVEAPETVQETQQGTPPAESQSNTRTVRLDEIRRFKAWAKKRNNPDPSKFRSDILSEDEKRAILADEVSADAGFFTVVLPSVWSGDNIPDAAESVAAWKAVLQLDEDDDEAERRAREAIERAAAEELAAALERQRRALLPSNVTPTSATDVVGRVEATSGTVRDALRRMLVQSADLGVSVAIAQFETIGFGFDWTLVNTDARDWANRYTGELITMINDTTRRQVQQAVVQWIENGDPLSALIRELAPTFGRDRAGLIASTEVTRAYAEANLLAYRQSGVVSQVQWMTSNDERVCPICAPLGGLTFGDSRSEPASIDDQNRRGVLASLAGGFIHPGGNGAAARFAGGNYRIPPAHPRCRCWIVPVIDEPEAQRVVVNAPGQFADLREAELWASQNYPGITWDFEGAHIDTINPTLKQFDSLSKQYPKVTERLRYVGTYRGKTPIIESNFSGDSSSHIAHAYSNGKQIGLNPEYYGNPDRFRETLSYSKKSQWTDADHSIESIMSHEYGHLVDSWLSNSVKEAWTDFVSLSGFGRVSDTLQMWREQNKATKLLSRYSTTNTQENFAEAFAALQHNRTNPPVFVKRFKILLDTIARPDTWTSSPTWVSDMQAGIEREQALEQLARYRKVLNIK